MAEIVDFKSFFEQRVQRPSPEMVNDLHQDTIEKVREMLGDEAVISYLEVSPLADFGPRGTADNYDKYNNVTSLNAYRAEKAQPVSVPELTEWMPPRRGRTRRFLGRTAARLLRGKSQRAA